MLIARLTISAFAFFCAGLASASMASAWAASPFEGRWDGPWQSGQGLAGRFAFAIDPNGAIKGTTVYADNHGTVSGTIDASGNLAATYSYGVVTYRMKGRFAISGDHLRGTAYYALPLGVPFDSGPVDLTRR